MSDYPLVIIEETDNGYKIVLDKEVVVFRNDANEVYGVICGFWPGKYVHIKQPLSILIGSLVDQSSPAFQRSFREGQTLLESVSLVNAEKLAKEGRNGS